MNLTHPQYEALVNFARLRKKRPWQQVVNQLATVNALVKRKLLKLNKDGATKITALGRKIVRELK